MLAAVWGRAGRDWTAQVHVILLTLGYGLIAGVGGPTMEWGWRETTQGGAWVGYFALGWFAVGVTRFPAHEADDAPDGLPAFA